MVTAIFTIIPRNYLVPKYMAVASISNSWKLSIPLTDRMFLAKAETSDRLIDNAIEFDDISAATLFCSNSCNTMAAEAEYWWWVSLPEIWSDSRDIDGIGGVVGVWDHDDGDHPITTFIHS